MEKQKYKCPECGHVCTKGDWIKIKSEPSKSKDDEATKKIIDGMVFKRHT